MFEEYEKHKQNFWNIGMNNRSILLVTLFLAELVLSAQERTDTISWRGFNVIIETSCFSTKTMETTFDGHRLGEMKQWFYVNSDSQKESIASSLMVFLGFKDCLSLPERVQKELNERADKGCKQSIKIKKNGLWERYDMITIDNVKVLALYQFVLDKDVSLFDSVMDQIKITHEYPDSCVQCPKSSID